MPEREKWAAKKTHIMLEGELLVHKEEYIKWCWWMKRAHFTAHLHRHLVVHPQ
jgi:hypothetical protein